MIKIIIPTNHFTLLQVDTVQPEEEYIRMMTTIMRHPHAGHHMVESTATSSGLYHVVVDSMAPGKVFFSTVSTS